MADARRPSGHRRHLVARRRSFLASLSRARRLIAVALAIAVAAAAALALLAAVAALHHHRRTFLERLDPHRQITDHVLIDAHIALKLVHRRRRRVEIEE